MTTTGIEMTLAPTNEPHPPLADAYRSAVTLAEQANADTIEAADAAADAARRVWIDSDEIREWEFRGESLGGGSERGHWHAPSQIESALTEWTKGGDYGEVERTFRVTDYARQIDPSTGEAMDEGVVSSCVEFQPEEPDCNEGDHDWQSPYEVVGGIRENPGVWGKGGGTVSKEVCAHCGRYRITDTWAQDRSTGEQGLTEVTYEDAEEASLAWIASLAEGEVL